MIGAVTLNCGCSLRAPSSSPASYFFTLAASRIVRSLLLRLHTLPQPALLPARRLSTMAPKQATLGYVKPNQSTLGCVCARRS